MQCAVCIAGPRSARVFCCVRLRMGRRSFGPSNGRVVESPQPDLASIICTTGPRMSIVRCGGACYENRATPFPCQARFRQGLWAQTHEPVAQRMGREAVEDIRQFGGMLSFAAYSRPSSSLPNPPMKATQFHHRWQGDFLSDYGPKPTAQWPFAWRERHRQVVMGYGNSILLFCIAAIRVRHSIYRTRL